MFESVGNMHMHTPYSDGAWWHTEIAEAAIEAGLDFLIITDHNVWVDGVEGYYQNDKGKVLLLVGEEVHNVRRKPQASHLLIYGAEREMVRGAANPQRLIDEAAEAGGYTFLAHPHEHSLPFFHETDLGWYDWDIENFTGLEIWNYMSCFKNRLAEEIDKAGWKVLALRRILQVVDHPERFVDGPEKETLALWDRLLAEGKKVTAVGNSDAHALLLGLGPIQRIIFPYEFLFRAVNTHVITREALNGDFEHDKRLILRAIGQGNSWVGYDMPQVTKGFRFTGQGLDKGIMGDKIRLDAGATLQVRTPTNANIRLIRHGTVVAKADNTTNLTHIPVEAGAYRVECTVPYLGQERGWIYSNPIYLW